MNEKKTKIISRHVIESLDVETGEVKKTTSFVTNKVENEPEYIKLYLADMSRWANLSKGASSILGAVLRYMNYENIIPLNACIKDTIARELKTTRGVVDVQINALCKKGLLSRVGTGTFLANPYTFGRGKWVDTKEIQATVVYNKDGVSFSVVTNPPKQLTIPTFEQEQEKIYNALHFPKK